MCSLLPHVSCDVIAILMRTPEGYNTLSLCYDYFNSEHDIATVFPRWRVGSQSIVNITVLQPEMDFDFYELSLFLSLAFYYHFLVVRSLGHLPCYPTNVSKVFLSFLPQFFKGILSVDIRSTWPSQRFYYSGNVCFLIVSDPTFVIFAHLNLDLVYV